MSKLRQLLDSLVDKPEVQSAIRAFIEANSRRTTNGNRTFRYMRVRPVAMTLTPAYPLNIWKRCEYFKPKGRGVTRGVNNVVPSALLASKGSVDAGMLSQAARNLRSHGLGEVASKMFDEARKLYAEADGKVK